jgi:integrase
VCIPAKLSETGKQQMKYFGTRDAASAFASDFKAEKLEHGNQAVTSEERLIVGMLRKELGGDLSLVPEILRHWKRTGEKLNQTSVEAAVKEFLDSADRDFSNHRTLNSKKERLEKFKAQFGARLIHEITPTDIERWLETYSAGWDRWGYHKDLGPFFKLAKRRRWVALNPMEEVPKPKTPAPERLTYTPAQFESMLSHCEWLYPELLPYVVFCGFCFLRTAELVRMYENEKVLRWENVRWDKGLIHVPVGVAKTTRRESGDERYIPLNDAAKRWLERIRKDDGDCVPCSASKFGKLWRAMMEKAQVPRVDNGLRHSAISYSLAANPEHGVALTSQWAGNSEKTIRKHYQRLIDPDQGKEWFAVTPFGWTEGAPRGLAGLKK